MQITKDTLLQLDNIITSAKLVDINELIITKDSLRGINSAKTAFVLSELELPDDFVQLAISRPDVYKSRFNLVKDIDDCKATAKVKSLVDDDFIEQIDFKSKSLKVQYRCCNPSMITAPKTINDAPKYTVKFSQEDVDTLLKASTSIDTANIKIVGSNEGLSYELVDLTGDTIQVDCDSQIDTDSDSFNFTFSFVQKPFLQLLKNCDNFEFSLGSKGILKITVNNITFHLLPQV